MPETVSNKILLVLVILLIIYLLYLSVGWNCSSKDGFHVDGQPDGLTEESSADYFNGDAVGEFFDNKKGKHSKWSKNKQNFSCGGNEQAVPVLSWSDSPDMVGVYGNKSFSHYSHDR